MANSGINFSYPSIFTSGRNDIFISTSIIPSFSSYFEKIGSPKISFFSLPKIFKLSSTKFLKMSFLASSSSSFLYLFKTAATGALPGLKPSILTFLAVCFANSFTFSFILAVGIFVLARAFAEFVSFALISIKFL